MATASHTRPVSNQTVHSWSAHLNCQSDSWSHRAKEPARMESNNVGEMWFANTKQSLPFHRLGAKPRADLQVCLFLCSGWIWGQMLFRSSSIDMSSFDSQWNLPFYIKWNYTLRAKLSECPDLIVINHYLSSDLQLYIILLILET